MKFRLRGVQNIYEEIAEQYRNYIRLGVIKDGEKLPSCRELALSLGINPNTVERAYAILEAEGLVVVLPKKGAYAISPKDGPQSLVLEEAKRQISAFRNAGIRKDELEQILDCVYEKENKENSPS